MPALAVTDLANTFGLVKFYKAARAHGIKPIFGCDVWLTHDAERDQPFRALLLAQSRSGYLRLAEWLTRAYRSNQYRGRAEMRHEWFDEGTDGLIALSGARSGDDGGGAPAGKCARRARKAARAVGGVVSGALLPRGAARRASPTTTRSSPRRCVSPRSSRCRSWRRTPCSSCAARTFARTRRACASRTATCSPIRGGRSDFTPEQYFTTQAEMAAALRRSTRTRSPIPSRSRSAAT